MVFKVYPNLFRCFWQYASVTSLINPRGPIILYISYITIKYGDIMSTTIALKDDTYFLLKMMKEELKTESYDETIQKIIAKTKKPQKSYF
jgi:hypothetical protein